MCQASKRDCHQMKNGSSLLHRNHLFTKSFNKTCLDIWKLMETWLNPFYYPCIMQYAMVGGLLAAGKKNKIQGDGDEKRGKRKNIAPVRRNIIRRGKHESQRWKGGGDDRTHMMHNIYPCQCMLYNYIFIQNTCV